MEAWVSGGMIPNMNSHEELETSDRTSQGTLVASLKDKSQKIYENSILNVGILVQTAHT